MGSNSTIWRCTLLLFVIYCTKGSESEELEELHRNSVQGEPYVNCAADAIYVKFRTEKTFTGHVNVKYTPNNYCYQVLVTNNQIEVLIPHEECAVNRKRSLHPVGVFLDSSLSVSFHSDFTTVEDRLFHFHCFHKAKDSKAKQLETGTPMKKEKMNSSDPSCRYDILDSPGGTAVGIVALGQKVYHQWTCHNVQNSCLVLGDCVLVAGDKRNKVIEEGCSLDKKIIPEPTIINQTRIGVNVSTFGSSMTSQVFFECVLVLQATIDGVCDRQECTWEKRRIRETDSVLEVQSQRIEISEFAPTLSSEPSSVSVSSECVDTVPSTSEEPQFCLSLNTFAIVSATIVGIVAFIIFVMFVALMQRYKHYNITHSN